MTPFRARVRREGGKPNLCITVPAPIAKQLAEVGLRPPSWVRLVVQSCEPVYVYARKPPSRPSVIVTLPRWAFFHIKAGHQITAEVQDATPHRARTSTDPRDWLPFVDLDTYLPTTVKGTLLLHSRHEPPFALKRFPNPQVVENLCARGVPSGKDYTITGPDTAAIASQLRHLGIDDTRMQHEGKTLRVLRSQPLVRLLRAKKENARAL